MKTNPADGDTRVQGGLTYIYKEPPGTWVIKPPQAPLVQKPRPDLDEEPG